MGFDSSFRWILSLLLLSRAALGQTGDANTAPPGASSSALSAGLSSATGERSLPYLIEVAGATDDELLPHEPETLQPGPDFRGKGDYELFQLAGEAYDRDDLETAAAFYQALIDRGVRHGDVYFNLANTYFRMSDNFGKAILYYEKALRLRPRDPDIRHNLDYAKTFLIDAPPKVPVSAMDTLLILHRQTTFNETFWILAFLNGLFVVLLLMRTLELGISRSVFYGYLRGAVAVLFVLQTFSAGAKVWESRNFREGVILSDGVQAKAAPTSDETLIELNSGTKVEILASRSGYAHIRLPDGTPAFITKAEVGEI